MNRPSEFSSEYDAILTQCLDAVIDGHHTVEECLQKYPDYADQLRTTLRLAVNLHKAQVVRPSLGFRKQAGSRLQSRLQHSARRPLPRQAKAQPRLTGFLPRLAFRAGIALILAAIIASTTGMAAYAADSAVPGDPLYQVDIAVEQAQISFASSPEQVLALNLQIANERLSEAEALISEGDNLNADTALSHYDETVTQIVAVADQVAPEGQVQAAVEVEASLSRNQERLQALLTQVPIQAQQGIQRAIEASQKGIKTNNGQGGPNSNPSQGNNPSEEPANNGQGNGNGSGINPGTGNSTGDGSNNGQGNGNGTGSSDNGSGNSNSSDGGSGNGNGNGSSSDNKGQGNGDSAENDNDNGNKNGNGSRQND